VKNLKPMLKLILFLSLGILASCYISGCSELLKDTPSVSPQISANTQTYEVNGARVCDDRNQTPTERDNCDYDAAPSGYYYGPGQQNLFYRGNGETLILERNKSYSVPLRPGMGVSMRSPVITNNVGAPLLNQDSTPTRINPSKATTRSAPITASPVRSSASFDHPSLGRVTAGKTTSLSRGMSFGAHSSTSGGHSFSG
jgi:outer membrane murein-binding lipoprotein Lpp